MKKKDIKPVMVEWDDSVGSSGWHHYIKRKMNCVTVGILFKEHKDRYVIALNWSPPSCGDYISIPKFAVTKITFLSPTNDR